MNSQTHTPAQAQNESQASIKATVSHQFLVKPEVVFDAWITPEKVKQWFAPGLGDMARVMVNARESGSFSFVQRRGFDEVDHIGTYLEFSRPHRLAFTWQVKGIAQASKVFIDIEATAAGSKLTLVHELQAHWADYREKTENAWSKMLSAMAAVIE